MRRNGKSLGEMIKDEIGPVTGLIAMIGILGIMIILLAVLVGRSKGTNRKSLGNVYDSSNDSYRYFNGSLYALY